MSNYPDDIHNYDNDPRSPFYSEPSHLPCDSCGSMEYMDDLTEIPYNSDLLCDSCYEEVLEE